MLIVEYDLDEMWYSAATSDGEVEKFVYQTWENYSNPFPYGDHERDLTITVSNEIVITAFRLAILRGDIDHQEIAFKFNGELLYPTEEGMLPHWPEGFCELSIKMHAEMISIRNKKVRDRIIIS